MNETWHIIPGGWNRQNVKSFVSTLKIWASTRFWPVKVCDQSSWQFQSKKSLTTDYGWTHGILMPVSTPFSEVTGQGMSSVTQWWERLNINRTESRSPTKGPVVISMAQCLQESSKLCKCWHLKLPLWTGFYSNVMLGQKAILAWNNSTEVRNMLVPPWGSEWPNTLEA